MPKPVLVFHDLNFASKVWNSLLWSSYLFEMRHHHRFTRKLLYRDHFLLTDKNTPVSHLAFTEGLHRLLNSLPVQGEGHRGRSDFLLGSKLYQRAQTAARCNKRSLDADTLDVHHEQRNGRRSQVNSQWVD